MTISKTAVDNLNFKNNIHFTNSAREGWERILQTIEPYDKVLLPAYIGITEREGSGIYDPIINNEIKHDFYVLNDDLSISIQKLKKMIETKTYKMILLVHYFGFKIHNIEEIVKLCKVNNMIVVEDCAHLYNYNTYDLSAAGTFGDFVFYSLHKFFPLKTGGLLVQNNLNILKPKKQLDNLKMNYPYELASYDLRKIVKKRIDNYNLMESLIQNINGIHSLKQLNKDDIPHNFPIIVENGLREKLYFWLIDNDITLIALYYRLINSIDIEEYKSSHFISNSILNLPIHQDIGEIEIKHITKLINKGIKELS